MIHAFSSASAARDSCSPSVCSTIAFFLLAFSCELVQIHRGEPGHTHTHSGRAHSRTRDEHTVTERESHDNTDPQRHTSSDINRFDPQTHGEEQVTHDPVLIRGDGPRGGRPRLRRGRPQRTQPCPLPLPQSTITEHLPTSAREGGRGERIRYHHWLDPESASITASGFGITIGWNRLLFAFRNSRAPTFV